MGQMSDSVDANTNGAAAVAHNEEDFDFTQKEDLVEKLDEDEELEKDDFGELKKDEELENDDLELKNDNEESKYKKQHKMKTEKEATKDGENTRTNETGVEAIQGHKEDPAEPKKDVEIPADDKSIEDNIYVARCVREIYTGERGEAQIQLDVVSDSKTLLDSVSSSKQVDNRLLRPVIKYMKQMVLYERLSWRHLDQTGVALDWSGDDEDSSYYNF